MKLLQRLRSMVPGVESAAQREPSTAMPGVSRDDFLDPPAKEAFEPVLIPSAPTGSGDDPGQR